jgi:dynein heavy chain
LLVFILYKGLTVPFACPAAACRYESAEPHQQALPGRWQELDGRFAALLLVKQLREEKLVFAAQQYVAAKLGREFTEPEPWTLDGVFQETSARTPIIFILSTGGCRLWHVES